MNWLYLILLAPNSKYNKQSTDLKDGRLFIEKITYSWIEPVYGCL